MAWVGGQVTDEDRAALEAWEAALENTNMVLKDGVNQLLIDITPEGTLFHILLDAEIGLRPTQIFWANCLKVVMRHSNKPLMPC